jgi:DNA-binding response OmpR family regulator
MRDLEGLFVEHLKRTFDDALTRALRAALRDRAVEATTSASWQPGRVAAGDLAFGSVLGTGYMFRNGEMQTPLTLYELRLLMILAENCDQIVSREDIMEATWPGKPNVGQNTLDAIVKRIRHKLGPARNRIKTVRRVGLSLSSR